MENNTTNKPRTRWWVGLILVLAIIIAGAPSVLYSIRYVAIPLLNDMRFSETIEVIPQEVYETLLNADNKEYAVNNWCDWMIQHDTSYNVWLKTYDDKALTNCVINSAAAKLIIEGQKIPDDMIFIFYGKPGWNQVGGRDMMHDDYNLGIFTCVTGNWDIWMVPLSRIDRLRWRVEDAAKPFYNASNPYIKYTWLTAVFIAAVIAAATCRRRTTTFAMAVAAPITAFTALAFAALGSQMLYHPKIYELPNIAICLIGAAAGISFISLASTLKLTTKTRLFCKLIILGAITGLITSCFAHAAIMAYRETTELSGIKGGAGYGIYAGVVIAILAFAVKSDSMNQEQPKPQEQI